MFWNDITSRITFGLDFDREDRLLYMHNILINSFDFLLKIIRIIVLYVG